MSKTKRLQQVISSNLRLLVLLRESLRAEGTPETNPLLNAIVTQANLCGLMLPNEMRVSKTELEAIRKGAGLIKVEAQVKEGSEIFGKPALPSKSGEMVILQPGQLPQRR